MKIKLAIAALLFSLSTAVFAEAVPCTKQDVPVSGTRFSSAAIGTNGHVKMCAPLDVPSSTVVVLEDGTTRPDTGWFVAFCADNGVCSRRNMYVGNAPKGAYIVQTGWYLGVDSHGNPAAYLAGTGPAFGGNRYGVTAQLQPGEKFHVVCPVNDSQYCTVNLNGYMFSMKMESLTTAAGIPKVNPATVKAQGGSCETIPMCYDKNELQVGVNAELLTQ